METDGPEGNSLPPAQAFAILGDPTRLRILQALGNADGPLSFSRLRERVGYESSGNFSYHLDKLVDTFVQNTERGYRLREAGKRVVEAVYSGVVTETATIERRVVDRSCPYCGAPVEMAYRPDRLEGYCTECAGVYGGTGSDASEAEEHPGYLGSLPLPPAGIQGRSIVEAEATAWTWGFRDMIALSEGVCPRCSGRLDQAAKVCPDHDTNPGLCDACRNRHAIQLQSACESCIFDHEGAFVLKLVAHADLLGFVIDHGLDPIGDQWEFGWTYDEEVLSLDPFEAQFTFSIDGDALSLTVNRDLEVVDTRQRVPDDQRE